MLTLWDIRSREISNKNNNFEWLAKSAWRCAMLKVLRNSLLCILNSDFYSLLSRVLFLSTFKLVDIHSQ